MFELQEEILTVNLPEGQTQAELVTSARSEIRGIVPQMYGKNVKINGRITTGMALVLGHEMAHICKSVSIFDPKLNEYITCIGH